MLGISSKITSSPRAIFLVVLAGTAALVLTQFTTPFDLPLGPSDVGAQNVVAPETSSDSENLVTATLIPANTDSETDAGEPGPGGSAEQAPDATVPDVPVLGSPQDPPDPVDVIPVLRPTSTWFNVFGESAMLNGLPVQIGDVIRAFDSEGTLAGQFTVTTVGKYGLMPVYEDDPATEVDEGTQPGDLLNFEINGVPAFVLGPEAPVWNKEGTLLHLNLSAGQSGIRVSP